MRGAFEPFKLSIDPPSPAPFTNMPSTLPPGWPPNLPDPTDHEYATFVGIKSWTGTLSPALQNMVAFHVFGVNHTQRAPTDQEWLGLIRVRRLFDVYCASPASAKSTFWPMIDCTSDPGAPIGDPPTREAAGVVSPTPPLIPPDWFSDVGGVSSLAGHDGASPGGVAAGQPPDVSDPTVPGYCYLHLFRSESRDRVSKRLGKNPWAPALAAALLEEPGVWSPDRFRLGFGFPDVTTGGPHYTQAHVVPVSRGLKVVDVVPRLAGFVRVGMATADLQALVGDLGEARVPSKGLAFDERPDRASVEVSLGVSAIVGTDQVAHPNFQWSVFSTPMMVAMLGIYESVRLVDAQFNVTVDTGASNVLYCAIAQAGVAISGSMWYSAPVNKAIHGSDQGSVTSTFVLPRQHSFAVEIRSRLPGNSPPVFHFGFVGAAAAKAVISGHVTVRCAGQALMGFIDIGGDGSTKRGRAEQARHLHRQVRSVQQSLGYDVRGKAPVVGRGDDSDSSDDDDEEEVAPARPSPPRAGPSAVGAGRTVARS